MSDALEYFGKKVGHRIDPHADVKTVLMRPYPHINPAKTSTTRLGSAEPARFLVSEDRIEIYAAGQLPETSGIEALPTSTRSRRDWMLDIIMSPPPCPFLVGTLGMSFSDTDFWRMTMSENAIVFGGNAAMHDGRNVMVVNRPRFVETVEWFRSTKASVADLHAQRRIKERFVKGEIAGQAARTAIEKLKTPADVMTSYAGVSDPFQMTMAAFVANNWVAT